MVKLNICADPVAVREDTSVGALPPFHVIEFGQFNIEDNRGCTFAEEAVTELLLVIVPGFTAATVGSLVS